MQISIENWRQAAVIGILHEQVRPVWRDFGMTDAEIDARITEIVSGNGDVEDFSAPLTASELSAVVEGEAEEA